jgi:cytochrome c556
MARRFAPLLALLAVLLAGCAYGTAARLTPAQEQARIAFIKAHKDFSDRDMAKLCPGLYPADFLTNHSKWPAGKASSGDKLTRITAQDRAAAQAAGCDVRPG